MRAYILAHCPSCHGFYGASSMERLPTETALTETTRRFVADHADRLTGDETMTGAQFGSFILGLIVVAIVVAIAVWLLHWLYLRSSKERSFVRTGLGGQKVVLDGGAFVLPIVHDVIPVNMNTLRLEVSARPRQGADHARPHARRRDRRVLRPRRGAARRRRRGGADARPAHHGARAAEGAGRGQVRRRAAHRGRRDDDGRAAREARRLRQARARGGRRGPDQERPRARSRCR